MANFTSQGVARSGADSAWSFLYKQLDFQMPPNVQSVTILRHPSLVLSVF